MWPGSLGWEHPGPSSQSTALVGDYGPRGPVGAGVVVVAGSYTKMCFMIRLAMTEDCSMLISELSWITQAMLAT